MELFAPTNIELFSDILSSGCEHLHLPLCCTGLYPTLMWDEASQICISRIKTGGPYRIIVNTVKYFTVITVMFDPVLGKKQNGINLKILL